MGRRKPACYLLSEVHYALKRQPPFSFQPVREGFAFDKLHCEKWQLVLFINRENADHIVMMNGGNSASFAQKTLPRPLIHREAWRDDFQGHDSIKLPIERFENDSHASSSDHFQDL